MKRKGWSLFLVAGMLFSLLPSTALAANATAVTVDGASLNASTPYLAGGVASSTGTLGEGGCTAYFDAASGVLTLKGLNTTGTVRSSGDLEIALEEENTVGSASLYGSAISVGGQLTISGSGTLQAAGTYRTIVAQTITLKSGNVVAKTANQGRSEPAVLGLQGVTVDGGSLTGISTGSGSWGYGIDCYDEGVITVNGGKVIAQGDCSAFGLVESTGKPKKVIVTKAYRYRTSSTGSYSAAAAETSATSHQGTYCEIAVGTDPFTVAFDGTTTGYPSFTTAWTAAQDAATEEGKPALLTMNEDYAFYSKSQSPFSVQTGDHIVLDLNGHTVGRTLSSARSNGRLFTVKEGGDFTLEDNSTTVPGRQGRVTGGYVNDSGGGGGAIQVDKGGRFTLNGGCITGNKAYQRGGGVYNQGTFSMNGGSLCDNVAERGGAGGGVSNFGSFTMTGGEIAENTAVEGGGVHNYGNNFTSAGPGSFTVTGGKIRGNTGESGGGIQNSGLLTVTGGEIVENVAYWGGGVYSWRHDDIPSAVTVGQDASIRDNRAFTDSDGSGGGIYLEDGDLLIEGGAISGNSSRWGGGIYIQTTQARLDAGEVASATIRGGKICDNSAGKYGGGLDLWDAALTMTGGEIALNSAAWGGGIHLGGGNFKFHGGAVVGNRASTQWGGGVYLGSGAVSFQGGPVIADNQFGGAFENGVLTGGAANNFFFGENTTAEIGSMESGARVGVSAEIAPAPNAPVPVSAGTGVTEEDFAKFQSDCKDYCLQLNGGKGALFLHTCDQSVAADRYLKTPADCIHNAVYYKSCICGEQGEETFEAVGTALGHSYVYHGEVSPTHGDSGVREHYSCPTCGLLFDRDKKQVGAEELVIEKSDHFFDAEWRQDGESHWRECSCGERTEVSPHRFKWVTDSEATASRDGSKREVCEICGYERARISIPATGSSDGPQTGDRTHSVPWTVPLALLAGTAIGTAVYRARNGKATK